MLARKQITCLSIAGLICLENGFSVASTTQIAQLKKVQSYQDEFNEKAQSEDSELVGQLDEVRTHFNDVKQKFYQAQEYQKRINQQLFERLGKLNERLHQLQGVSSKVQKTAQAETIQFQSPLSYGGQGSYGGGESYGGQSSPHGGGGSYEEQGSYGNGSQKESRQERRDQSDKKNGQEHKDRSDRKKENTFQKKQFLPGNLSIPLFTQIGTLTTDIDDFQEEFVQAQQNQSQINKKLFGQIDDLNKRLNTRNSLSKAGESIETENGLLELTNLMQTIQHEKADTLRVQNSDSSRQITHLSDRVSNIDSQFSQAQKKQSQVNQQLFAEVNSLTKRIDNY